MKTYIVWKYVLGCPPELTRDYEIVEAKSQDEAENLVADPYGGWGILGSREWTKEDEENPVTFDLWN